MKTHYAEQNDDVISSKDTADDHCWREHQVKKTQIIGEAVLVLTVIVALAFSGALVSPPTPAQPEVASQAQPTRAGPTLQYSSRAILPHVRKADASDDH